MAEKKYKGSPFGTQTARFDVSGVHPKSKVPGTYTQTPYCKRSTDPLNVLLGPGRYDPEQGGFSDKALQAKSTGPGWARQYEVARMAALPHLLHKEQWQQKKMLERKLGPGSYDIKDFLQVTDEKPKSIHGICNTTEERFKEKSRNELPGPGTYGIGGVPHTAIEEKSKKSASTVGMLDASASSRRTLPTVGSNLGPGNYNYTSFADEITKKVTSLRGPYDLFSEDRNKPLKTGHLAVPQSNPNLGPGQYEVKSSVDDWNSSHRSRHGKFSKLQQYPEKPGNRIFVYSVSQNRKQFEEPGPGSYDPKAIPQPLTQAKNPQPFQSSAQRSDRIATKFFTGNFNPVGPGRYDIQKRDDTQYVNGHINVFKSRSGRPTPAKEKFLRERLSGKDTKGMFMVRHKHPGQLSRTKTQLGVPSTEAHPCSERAVTVA